MPCPFCQTAKTNPRSKKTALGYATFYCPACRRTFNERTGTPFNELQTRSEIVFLVVMWRLRYKLSLRDVAEMMLERNITITYETVRLWEARFAPLLTAQLKAKRKMRSTQKWHVDETYLKVNKKNVYLYRAIDSQGNLVDVRLSETRDMAAAKAFFTQAVATVGFTPQTITTDKHASFPTAIEETLGKKVEHRSNHYLNNLIEQDHRGVKQRYYPMKTFKTMKSGSRFCSAFEEQRAYFRERHGKNVTWKPYMKRGMFKARFLKLRYEFIAA